MLGGDSEPECWTPEVKGPIKVKEESRLPQLDCGTDRYNIEGRRLRSLDDKPPHPAAQSAATALSC